MAKPAVMGPPFGSFTNDKGTMAGGKGPPSKKPPKKGKNAKKKAMPGKGKRPSFGKY